MCFFIIHQLNKASNAKNTFNTNRTNLIILPKRPSWNSIFNSSFTRFLILKINFLTNWNFSMYTSTSKNLQIFYNKSLKVLHLFFTNPYVDHCKCVITKYRIIWNLIFVWCYYCYIDSFTLSKLRSFPERKWRCLSLAKKGRA